MRSLLFGIGPTDVLTLSLMAAILLVVALMASYLPARRAACVDPMGKLVSFWRFRKAEDTEGNPIDSML